MASSPGVYVFRENTVCRFNTNKLGNSISYNSTCAHSEDSDQPAHPRSLISFALRQTFGYPQCPAETLIRLRGYMCSLVRNAVPWLKSVRNGIALFEGMINRPYMQLNHHSA